MSVRGYIDIWYPYWQRGIKTKKVLSTLHGSWHVKTNHEKFKFIQSIWSKNKKVVFSPHLYKNYFFRGFRPIFGRFWHIFNSFWAIFGHLSLIFGQFWQKFPSKLSFTLIYIKVFFSGVLSHFWTFLALLNTFFAIFVLFPLILGIFTGFATGAKRPRENWLYQTLAATQSYGQGPAGTLTIGFEAKSRAWNGLRCPLSTTSKLSGAYN